MPPDDHQEYLARVSRRLRATAADDELRVATVGVIAAGRRRVKVEVAVSDRHGAAVRLSLREPPPTTAGAAGRQTFVFLAPPEVGELIAALTEAAARLKGAK